ncbi:hypothetical protein SAMN05216584_11440 [Selenomonas sp. WCT3]|uniref:hypothetical protein n=1 Tax=Selenomonas sp. WCT3 TaxID=3158785 RepID=UPI000880B080|nr:hypothetical protein SAMN05216584_11440 [Selenomonas ruminantium]
MTNLKISKPLVCFSISLMTLVKGMDKYINEKLLWGCLLILFICLAVYCWKKLHQKIILLSFGLFGASCLIEFFWQTDTPYDGMIKNMVGLWMIFFAIASVLISKMNECNDADKKIVNLIVGLFGGSIFLLCAIAYIGFLIKS